jgi:hypothetical protein
LLCAEECGRRRAFAGNPRLRQKDSVSDLPPPLRRQERDEAVSLSALERTDQSCKIFLLI